MAPPQYATGILLWASHDNCAEDATCRACGDGGIVLNGSSLRGTSRRLWADREPQRLGQTMEISEQ